MFEDYVTRYSFAFANAGIFSVDCGGRGGRFVGATFRLYAHGEAPADAQAKHAKTAPMIGRDMRFNILQRVSPFRKKVPMKFHEYVRNFA